MVLQNGKHVCNVCGETYDSALALGVHGQVHDKEVITGVLVECRVCGKEERVPPSRAEDYKVCSNECDGEEKRKRSEVTCEICGKTERVPNSRAERYVTCSKECWSKLGSNEIEVTCEVCGKTEKLQEAHAKRYVTCSNECSGKVISEKLKNSDVSDNIEKIAERYKNGEPASLIAEDYDVCNSTILRSLHERDNVEVRSSTAQSSIETAKGHDVRSSCELKVANFLYRNDVEYEYEPQMPGPCVPDFAIDGKLIEVWGMTGYDEYDKERKEKERWYDANGIDYIGIEPVDLENLEECLSMFI